MNTCPAKSGYEETHDERDKFGESFVWFAILQISTPPVPIAGTGVESLRI